MPHFESSFKGAGFSSCSVTRADRKRQAQPNLHRQALAVVGQPHEYPSLALYTTPFIMLIS